MQKKILLLTIAAFVLVFVALYFTISDSDYKYLSKNLKVSHLIYNPDKKLSSFSLIDHNNNKFENENLKDEWTVLTFIYTHCPDVCPTELMNISTLKSKIKKSNSSFMPNFVVITFDPIRDTPEILKSYVTHFDEDFLGVSGDQNQIDQLVKDFGAYYERVMYSDSGELILIPNYEKIPPEAMENGYSINHTAWVYLVNPGGQIHAGFPAPHKPNDMLEDIKLLVDNY
ncbi:MAG: SCO family protein [Gammaproteobacteria bacterium]|nr:SCO family protein [Gammaproteobacteria bacterium]